MSTPINIVIVEDNKRFAQALNEAIELTDGLTALASFNSAESCATSISSIHACDIFLLDLQLPGMSGLELVPTLKQHCPKAQIIVLTQHNDYQTTLDAIRLGVAGYILKESTLAEIRDAIREVHQGGSVIDPKLSRLLLNTLSSAPFEHENPLSSRERQVLDLMARGFVKKQVADELGISHATVSEYTGNIYKKLQVPNIAAAIATAIRKGLI
ncbi:response regulator [Coraliomargarita akajimensis]|uniref:Two component transcriptional regulator, LuxR family n=1 Tax=Coraliomargarita akajimensis (strain DSM 45221 / IAM 15411 / JCM 23193 / KCTC 12865 / 04OKA010-24) TaxID=583355 RepID=D5ENS0_CORAD|nr:response regulator transcription factor [Coraliomargarita akajimensis]ADE53579.1 two component transcriptional regulator, LuxR family [Coraliomargarita akajimensis DSM 45221]